MMGKNGMVIGVRTVQKVGDSCAVIIPMPTIRSNDIEVGDHAVWEKMPDGRFLLTFLRSQK